MLQNIQKRRQDRKRGFKTAPVKQWEAHHQSATSPGTIIKENR
jgi:hypothetical protein